MIARGRQSGGLSLSERARPAGSNFLADAAPTSPVLPASRPARRGFTLRRAISAAEFGPLVLLVLEIAIFTGINPDFLSILNISNTLTFTVELGLIALAMTLLMTAGEFDLSVGSLFGFAPVMMWTLFNGGVTSLGAGFAASLVVAALIGLVNGLMVTRL